MNSSSFFVHFYYLLLHNLSVEILHCTCCATNNYIFFGSEIKVACRHTQHDFVCRSLCTYEGCVCVYMSDVVTLSEFYWLLEQRECVSEGGSKTSLKIKKKISKVRYDSESIRLFQSHSAQHTDGFRFWCIYFGNSLTYNCDEDHKQTKGGDIKFKQKMRGETEHKSYTEKELEREIAMNISCVQYSVYYMNCIKLHTAITLQCQKQQIFRSFFLWLTLNFFLVLFWIEMKDDY